MATVSRREAVRRALKGATYAAPVVLMASVPRPVAAASPLPTGVLSNASLTFLICGITGQPGAFLTTTVTFTLRGAAPSASFDVYTDRVESHFDQAFFATFTTDAAGNADFNLATVKPTGGFGGPPTTGLVVLVRHGAPVSPSLLQATTGPVVFHVC